MGSDKSITKEHVLLGSRAINNSISLLPRQLVCAAAGAFVLLAAVCSLLAIQSDGVDSQPVARGHLRVNFLVGGAQKSGTTFLHSLLRLHPKIWMTTPKEPHFWDRVAPAGHVWPAHGGVCSFDW